MIARVLQLIRNAGWREFVLLLTVAAMCTGVAVFIEIADEVSAGGFQQMEEHFIRSLRQADDPAKPIGPWWMAEAGRDLTALGGTTVLTVMIILVVGYLLLAKRYHATLLVIIATVGGLLLSTVLKLNFERDRPEVVPHLTQFITASFPSGHSMLSSVVYLTLGALLARTVERRRIKIYFIHAALFITFLVGASRVYLGVHYPTDVLAGWAAGTSWALLCYLVAYWLQSRGAVESPPLPAADADDANRGETPPPD